MPKEDWKFTGKFEKNTGENQENGIYQFRPEKRTRLRTL